MAIYDATAVRLQLLANGYTPTPNLNKSCVLKGWNTQAFADSLNETVIRGWARERETSWMKATGLQARNGLMPIDFDIKDEDAVEQMLDELARLVGEDAFARMPWRTGNYPKLMVLARWGSMEGYDGAPISGIERSDKFTDAAGNKHMVEIFGGALSHGGKAAKQIGVYGPHSHELKENGKADLRKVIRNYSWDTEGGRPTLLDTRLEDLPVVTPAQMWALLAAFERVATDRGWTREVAPGGGAKAKKFNYTITPETVLKPQHGEPASLYDLDEGTRVDGSFIDGSAARNDKCIVSFCKARNSIGVWDYESDAWHLPVEAAPPSVEDQAKAFQAALGKLQAARVPTSQRTAPPKPKAADGLAAQAYWLLQTYAYCPPSHSVVELFEPSDSCELRTQAFQTKYLAWREDSLGPQGGRHTALATAAWLIHADRPTIRGVRMRPDMDYPLYVDDDGEMFKNTYLRPVHAGDGNEAAFLAFMEHLLPIEEERTWFLDWLAHKHRYPDIPGVAIVMVAADESGPVYGAGRGMLRDILARLMGPRYVRAIDFDVFSGRSAQGVYTDWAAYATLVTVSESRDTIDSGRWSAQRAVYERLKEIVDPRAIERTFMRKGLPAFVARSFASYMIFSNNLDALQIPADDRRITALRNGARLEPVKAQALQEWMEMPGNIAALARFLDARDLTRFDAYSPLKTATKTTMQELARSELDDAYDAVRRRIGPQRLFTGEQVRQAVLAEMGDVMGSDMMKHQVTRKLRSDATRIGCQMPPSAGRHWILAWRSSAADVAELATVDAQRSVNATAQVLFDLNSSVLAWPGAGPSAPEKE